MDDELKKEAIDFADWLWHHVDEVQMSEHDFGYFYDMWKDSTSAKE